MRRILGLEIFGVDAIDTPDGPLVIEVNEFPNFTDVLGAAEAIAHPSCSECRRVVPPSPRSALLRDVRPTCPRSTIGASRMRIAFLLEPTRHGRGLAPVITETVDRPRGRGVQVDLLFAQDGSAIVDLSNLRPEHDLYVLKSKSPLTHSLAGAIEADGGFVVNSFASAILTWVKVATTGVLAAAGIPVPASWTAGRASLFRSLIEQGPLWLKPQHGKSGSGVRRVDDLTTLEGQPVPAADTFGYPVPVFAQRDVSSGGLDFKVYVIGDRLWSMVKHVHQRRQDHLHDRGVQVYSMNVDQTPRVGALQAPPARHVRRGRPIGAGSLRRGQPCSRH